MHNSITRRSFGMALASAAATAAGSSWASSPTNQLVQLEQMSAGRLGVFALDSASGRALAWRADERFLMCSTFKTLLVSAVLAEVEAGREQLDRPVAYGPADLLSYAPVTRAHVAEGSLPVEALCAAAVQMSDNTAANLLYPTVKGPEGLTRFLRKLGDQVTRLDRTEPTANVPSGDLDTTTPKSMAVLVSTLLTGPALGAASKRRLQDWMVTSTPGSERLRAGLPPAWRVGDKSGTGDAQTNDVAVIWPTERAPIYVSAYLEANNGGSDANQAALREVGRIVAAWA
jgi:beta-lactamase class A